MTAKRSTSPATPADKTFRSRPNHVATSRPRADVFRAITITALGVVLGFLLGGVGPRRELDELTLEVKQLKRQLERVDQPSALRALLPQLLRGRDNEDELPTIARGTTTSPPFAGAAQDPADPGAARAENDRSAVIISGSEREGARTPSGIAAKGEGTATGPTAAAAKADGESDAKGARRPGFDELNLARFDQVSAAQAMRFAASRAAPIEQAGLSDKETAAVDGTVKKMNDDLSGYGEEILSQASAEEAPSPAQALGLGHDVSGIMYEGQKQIDSIVGARAAGVDPEAMQIWNFIDIKRLRPAAEKFLPKEAGKPAPAAPPAGSTGGTKSETDKEPE